MTVTIATLGFPRIGPRRELKFALESFWSGKSAETELLDAAAALRAAHWARQHALGTDWLPSGDFSLYDHILNTSLMLSAVPARYGAGDGTADLATCFAMARGTNGGCGHASVTAGEMTKWFDTNYHYIVPEIAPGRKLSLARYRYPSAIGPGVYDIHSARVPGEDEMVRSIRLAEPLILSNRGPRNTSGVTGWGIQQVSPSPPCATPAAPAHPASPPAPGHLPPPRRHSPPRRAGNPG